MFGRQGVEYKTPAQIAAMRRAGVVVARTLEAVTNAVAPGVTPAELDAIASQHIADGGATSSFLGYEGFPATICVSVNEAVIHGIPGDMPLQPGDVVSVDSGAIVDGWHADAARTVIVPHPDESTTAHDERLVSATRDAMWDGIASLATVRRVRDVGAAIEASVDEAMATDEAQYGIVEDFVGHGIGSQMHQDPDVPNFAASSPRTRIRPGMCLAIEPMLTRGSGEVCTCEDDWTVVTVDGSTAAHWENTVAILDDGIFVLTEPDGGAAELAKRGVTLGMLVD
ncbi:methionyl aminopeptidase [Micrococcales bacterium KH10]|nr:methionyl aminopeptidase [Micrococcales bacterium KH10]